MTKLTHDIQDPVQGQFLIYQAEEDELAPVATVKKYLTVRWEGSPEVKLPKLFQQIETSKQNGGHLNDDF
jgi:hypothetical protein